MSSEPGSPVFRKRRKRRKTEEEDTSVSPSIHLDDLGSINSYKKIKLEKCDNECEIRPDAVIEDKHLLNTVEIEPEKVKVEIPTVKCESDVPESSGGQVQFVTASSLLGRSPGCLSLGCPLLDHALRGGLRRGGLTEVVGESSAGKTQFCLQCTVQAARRGEKVVYLCTEGGFPQARLHQMVGDRKQEMELVLVQQVRDIHHLVAVLGSQLEAVVRDVTLLVVDSLAAAIRYDGDVNISKHDRANTVHNIGQILLHLTIKHTIAVLVVNQVTDKFDQLGFDWGRKLVASLGQTWSNYPHTRLWLTKTRLVIGRTASILLKGLEAETRLRTMEVDFSCRLPNSCTYFIVDTKGLSGVRVTG